MGPFSLAAKPSPARQCLVRFAMDPCVQTLKVAIQFRLVVLPRHAVHARRRTALERHEPIPKQIDRHVVQ